MSVVVRVLFQKAMLYPVFEADIVCFEVGLICLNSEVVKGYGSIPWISDEGEGEAFIPFCSTKLFNFSSSCFVLERQS